MGCQSRCYIGQGSSLLPRWYVSNIAKRPRRVNTQEAGLLRCVPRQVSEGKDSYANCENRSPTVFSCAARRFKHACL